MGNFFILILSVLGRATSQCTYTDLSSDLGKEEAARDVRAGLSGLALYCPRGGIHNAADDDLIYDQLTCLDGDWYGTKDCESPESAEIYPISDISVVCEADALCKSCAANLIAVTETGQGAKPMDGDVTVVDGACAERTFTCSGIQATIELFGNNGSLGAIQDAGTGTASVTVTCNKHATGWEAQGHTITGVECAAVPPCRTCAADLITITTSGSGAKPMDSDVTLYTSGCAERMFTCSGRTAMIEVFVNGVSSGGIPDIEGTATFTVACNAQGTAWEAVGVNITGVECSAW